MVKKYSRILVFSLIFLIACGKEEAPQMPPTVVGAVKVVKADLEWAKEYPAHIAGSLEVQIRAQVGGILKERYYTEGQFIEKDQPLVLIDPEPYKIKVEQAEGDVARAESDLKRSERDFERMKNLIKDNAISQRDYDNTLSQYETAQANLKIAQGALDQAKINLQYTNVNAPISGIVGKEAQSVGSLIDIQGESSLLTTMVQIDPLYVVFAIPSADAAKFKIVYQKGNIVLPNNLEFPVKVILPDGREYPHEGKIFFIDSTEDSKTGSIAAKAEIPNTDTIKELQPGQFVRVRIFGVRYEDALVIPSTAVINTGESTVVHVLKPDNTTETRTVEAGVQGKYAVVVKGLDEGEIVVSQGAFKVKDGAPVKYELQEPELPAGSKLKSSQEQIVVDATQAAPEVN